MSNKYNDYYGKNRVISIADKNRINQFEIDQQNIEWSGTLSLYLNYTLFVWRISIS